MLAYASQTSGRRNLAELSRYGWRLLITPYGGQRCHGFKYCLDNGAWHAHISGESWSARKFTKLVERLGWAADFIVAPDIVAGGLQSLALSEAWLTKLEQYPGKVLIAVQDGMNTADVEPLLSERVGIFLGGSTQWKLATMRRWGDFCRHVKCYYHVARVNSVKRIYMCAEAGADSFDGTSASIYSCNTRRLDNARRQKNLW